VRPPWARRSPPSLTPRAGMAEALSRVTANDIDDWRLVLLTSTVRAAGTRYGQVCDKIDSTMRETDIVGATRAEAPGWRYDRGG
jgi:hypothetical protein